MLEKISTGTATPRRFVFTSGRLMMAVFVFASLWFGSIVSVHAQAPDLTQGLNQTTKAAGVPASQDLFVIIGRVINIALGTVGVVLLGLLLYAGFLWMTSGGSEDNVKKAQTMIKNAIIGLLIVVSAFAITNFILSKLSDISNGGGGIFSSGPGAMGFPGAAGALGGGIIEFHMPQRDATGVPRNTAIAITFKEPIKMASMIENYTPEMLPATYGINSAVVRISRKESPEVVVGADQVRVRVTPDHKTFVFYQFGCRPDATENCIGSSVENTMYQVKLMPGVSGVLLEDGTPAFGQAFKSGYEWNFEVSTILDLTPPKIVSIIPAAGGLYAPNIIVQVNFNEAVDPTTAAGTIKDGAGFTNLEVSAVPEGATDLVRPNGTFQPSNAYTTVEFVTDLQCGTNSCGRKIYCLPSNAAITVLVKAATLSNTPPQAAPTDSGLFDGVADLAANSLDGNGDGIAQGPNPVAGQTDNYQWTFATTDKPNLVSPRIKTTLPTAGNFSSAKSDPAGSSDVSPAQTPEANFDSVLQASTINTSNVLLKHNEPKNFADTFWWSTRQYFLNKDGIVPKTPEDPVVAGRVSIQHRLYLPAPDQGTAPVYMPLLMSDVQNVYQNCFNPAASEACNATLNPPTPNCCNGKISSLPCQPPK